MAKTVEHELYRTSDLAEKINAAAKNTDFFAFPESYQIRLVLECDEKSDINKALQADPRLHQEIIDAIQNHKGTAKKELKKLIEKFGAALEDINKFAAQGRLEEADAAFARYFSQEVFTSNSQVAIDAMVNDAKSAWENLCKVKTAYRKYQIRIVANYTIITAGIAVNVGINVAVIASSGFHFGAGTVLSVLGLIRSTMSLARLTVNCFKSVDTAIKEAMDALLSVQKKKDRKWLGNIELFTETMANELADELLKLPGFFDTIKKVEEKVELARNKLNGTEIQLHTLAESIQKTIEAQDQMLEKLEIMRTAGALETIPKKLRFDRDKLIANQNKLTKLLKKNEKKDTEFKIRKKALDDIERQLVELQKHTSTKITEATRLALSGTLKAINLGVSLATMDFSAATDIASLSIDLGLTGIDKGTDAVLKLAEKLKLQSAKQKCGWKGSAET
ncbi:MAG: hypothetical protein JNM40_08230 [Myxococcales bacterium]|nr:hypothetical protein [Myxococcales bacterium]